MGLDGNQTETNGEFALTFRSSLNEEFTTSTLNVYNLTEWALEEAINALPNKVCARNKHHKHRRVAALVGGGWCSEVTLLVAQKSFLGMLRGSGHSPGGCL